MRSPQFKMHLQGDEVFYIEEFDLDSKKEFRTLRLSVPPTASSFITLFYRDDKPIRQLARLLQDAGYLNPETEE